MSSAEKIPTASPSTAKASQSITYPIDKILGWALPLCVFLLPLLLYLPTARFELLQWDDDIEISQNPYIQQLSWANIHWMFTDISRVRRYIPLDWLGWGVNYQLAKTFTGDGLNPAWYHVGNALFQAAIALVLYFILRRILRLFAPSGARIPRAVQWAAAFGALFWAVHPLRVEAVAWANSRIHEQALFFVALSFLLYLQAHDPNRRSSSYWRLFIGSLILYFCSLLSYGTTLGYVVILLVADVMVLRRVQARQLLRIGEAGVRKVLLEKVPYLAAAGIYLGITLWATFNATGIWQKPVTLAAFGLTDRFMQAAYLLAYYLWKPFASLRFSPVCTTLVRFSPSSAPFVISLLSVMAIAGVAFFLRRRAPLIMALFICHVALLFPMLGWTEHPHYPSDRYSYIQGILWSVAFGAILLLLYYRAGKYVRVGALFLCSIGLLVAGSVVTVQQSQIWRNNEALFTHMIRELGNDPYREDIYLRLGRLYIEQNRLPEALRALDESIAAVPNNVMALRMKGNTLVSMGDIESANGVAREQVQQTYLEAARTIEQCVQITGAAPDLTFCGYAYGKAGDIAKALPLLKLAAELAPNHPVVHLKYGEMLYYAGKTSDAVAELDRAATLMPALQSHRQEILAEWKAAARFAATVPGKNP